MKTKYAFLALMLFFVGLYLSAGNTVGEEQFDLQKREILLREIGHQILLQSGDSVSRVLPVKKISDGSYQLRFEKQFTFDTDSLVSIIKKSLAAGNIPDYIVNVLDCSGKEVVYGYTVSNRGKSDIIPCQGRKQPYDCYIVSIKFRDNITENKTYTAGISISILAAVGFFVILLYRKKKNNNVVIHDVADGIFIGNIRFDKIKKSLITTEETINLTSKEYKLLSIFAQNLNEVIDRKRLQKEIWEDDGLIVGRSLDVFISKLRKKLESDANVQLVNVHGKGYKLQIDDPVT